MKNYLFNGREFSSRLKSNSKDAKYMIDTLLAINKKEQLSHDIPEGLLQQLERNLDTLFFSEPKILTIEQFVGILTTYLDEAERISESPSFNQFGGEGLDVINFAFFVAQTLAQLLLKENLETVLPKNYYTSSRLSDEQVVLDFFGGVSYTTGEA